ncbi:DUF4960 domain-containing protein [Rufibacter sp. XAAS-G3-1]|uniref:DUF4960 domain-containing protein n=1 Tax=Rufibacter sp. XAAS-G3-1 TaxID=2729134 RepID=UPI0015E775F4|nr:DUF4960 domain-containing protein [Rufibacter sp. XAAS-G3-1]
MLKTSIPRTNGLLAILFFSMLSMLFSCEDDNDNPDFMLDAPVQINSFKINGVNGEINQNTGQILFTLPYNSNITSVTPEIALPEGASISPDISLPADYSQEVTYTVVNGNRYKDYKVRVQVMQPIIKFAINGVDATINNAAKSITIVLPTGTDITALAPEIETSAGVSISPASGVARDFSTPQTYTITIGSLSEDYTVTVSQQTMGLKVAFLGVAANRGAITNPDEKAAADWLFAKFSGVSYVSFNEVKDGIDLSAFDVIWWHYDAAMDLPGIAFDANVVNALKAYRAAGGNLLLTTFAARYLEPLNIVPAGKGPNNVFGDFLPAGFVDANNSWGISFRGREDHPIFAGLQTYEPGKAYLLEKGTFRLNHVAWWFLPEWGGYGNGQGWRQQTGGNNLASEQWDDQLNGRVSIGEFSGNGTTDGNVIVIGAGAYDWYNEPSNGTPSQTNGYISNIERLTENIITYLAE